MLIASRLGLATGAAVIVGSGIAGLLTRALVAWRRARLAIPAASGQKLPGWALALLVLLGMFVIGPLIRAVGQEVDLAVASLERGAR